MSTINIDEAEFKRLLDERQALRDNLTATQERCTHLINESRQLARDKFALQKQLVAFTAPFGTGDV